MTGVGFLFARERKKSSETEINVDQHRSESNRYPLLAGKILAHKLLDAAGIKVKAFIFC